MFHLYKHRSIKVIIALLWFQIFFSFFVSFCLIFRAIAVSVRFWYGFSFLVPACWSVQTTRSCVLLNPCHQLFFSSVERMNQYVIYIVLIDRQSAQKRDERLACCRFCYVLYTRLTYLRYEYAHPEHWLKVPILLDNLCAVCCT